MIGPSQANEDTRGLQEHDCSWDCTLRFRDPTLEKRYLEETLKSRVEHEKKVHLQGLFPGVILAVSQRHLLSMVGMVVILFSSLGLATTFSYLAWWRKDIYMKWRTVIVVVLTWYAFYMTHFWVERDTLPAPVWYGVLSRVLVTSPTTAGLFMSLNAALSFRQQALLQIFLVPGLLQWASIFCTTCDGSSDHTETFQSIGMYINLVLSRAKPGEDFGCLPVISAVVVTTGFLVPLALVYYLDIYRRSSFAETHLPPRMALAIEESKSDSRELGAWYFFIGIELVWQFCRFVTAGN